MAYDLSKLVRVSALQQLAQKVKENYYNKDEIDDMLEDFIKNVKFNDDILEKINQQVEINIEPSQTPGALLINGEDVLIPEFISRQEVIEMGGDSKPTFTGTQATITVEGEYTPAGSVSLTGKATDTFVKTASLQGTPTAFEVSVDDNETLILPDLVLEDLGTVNVNTSTGTVVTALTGATFSGTKATITSTGTYTPAGSVSQPTFSGTQATITVTSTGNFMSGVTGSVTL